MKMNPVPDIESGFFNANLSPEFPTVSHAVTRSTTPQLGGVRQDEEMVRHQARRQSIVRKDAGLLGERKSLVVGTSETGRAFDWSVEPRWRPNTRIILHFPIVVP